jgi:hypothetical protein
VDDAPADSGVAGMSASAVGQMGSRGAQMRLGAAPKP